MKKQSPAKDPPTARADLVASLGVLAQVFQSRAREILAPHDLTLTQMTVLSHLEHLDEGSTVGALAEAIDIQQPGVSKVVAALEKRGDVTVVRGLGGRASEVRLAEAGRDRLAAVRNALESEVAAWVGHVREGEVPALARTLRHLADAIDARRGTTL